MEDGSSRAARLEQIVQSKNNQLRELEHLPSQLLVREEEEEKVKRQLQEAQSQLAAAQHEAAMLRSQLVGDQQHRKIEEEYKQAREQLNHQVGQYCTPACLVTLCVSL